LKLLSHANKEIILNYMKIIVTSYFIMGVLFRFFIRNHTIPLLIQLDFLVYLLELTSIPNLHQS